MAEINATTRVQNSMLNSPPPITDTSKVVSTPIFGSSIDLPSNINYGLEASLFSTPMTNFSLPTHLDAGFIDNIFTMLANTQSNFDANPFAQDPFGIGMFTDVPMGFDFTPLGMPSRQPLSWQQPHTDTPKLRDSARTTSRMQATQYDEMIERIAKEEGVDPKLIKAMMKQESAGNSGAISNKGAGGLMQLMPATAKALGVQDRFDPEQNIRGGTKYIAQQLKAFNGDVKLALAAYNAGPGAVKKYGGNVPPYKETQNYVAKIMGNYEA